MDEREALFIAAINRGTVTLWSHLADKSEKAAVYLLGADGTVTVEILDEQFRQSCEEEMREGIGWGAGQRALPSDGRTFLRALLERNYNLTYYSYE